MTPMQAIRLKCRDCMCDAIKEIELCPIDDCSLYPFRMGKNPNIKARNYSDEQREKFRANIRKIHSTVAMNDESQA